MPSASPRATTHLVVKSMGGARDFFGGYAISYPNDVVRYLPLSFCLIDGEVFSSCAWDTLMEDFAWHRTGCPSLSNQGEGHGFL